MSASFVPPDGFVEQAPVSGFGRHNGPLYAKEIEGGGVIRAFHVLDRHLNSAGVVHGGMLATFMDMILADAVRRGCGRLGFTVRLVSDFQAPAKLGEWVEGQGILRRATRTLAFVDGYLRVGGRQVMTGQGIFALSAAKMDEAGFNSAKI